LCAAEKPEWLLGLLKDSRGVNPRVPSSLIIFCTNFSKHLKGDADIVYECLQILSQKQLKSTTVSSTTGFIGLRAYPFLHIAIQSFNLRHFQTYNLLPRLIKEFVRLGYDINLQNDKGKTVFHWIHKTGKPNLIALCRQLGAKDEILDSKGKKPSDCVLKKKFGKYFIALVLRTDIF